MTNKKYPKPRKWYPQNPEKYIGDINNIIMRSSWEIKLANWFDKHPSVVFWNSESAVVPYYNQLDGKMHKYYVDFMAKMKLKDGSFKTYAIEVKPRAQTEMPRTRNKKRLVEETVTYLTNQAKWEAAKSFFSKHGIEFIVLTEDDLGIT